MYNKFRLILIIEKELKERNPQRTQSQCYLWLPEVSALKRVTLKPQYQKKIETKTVTRKLKKKLSFTFIPHTLFSFFCTIFFLILYFSLFPFNLAHLVSNNGLRFLFSSFKFSHQFRCLQVERPLSPMNVDWEILCPCHSPPSLTLLSKKKLCLELRKTKKKKKKKELSRLIEKMGTKNLLTLKAHLDLVIKRFF